MLTSPYPPLNLSPPTPPTASTPLTPHPAHRLTPLTPHPAHRLTRRPPHPSHPPPRPPPHPAHRLTPPTASPRPPLTPHPAHRLTPLTPHPAHRSPLTRPMLTPHPTHRSTSHPQPRPPPQPLSHLTPPTVHPTLPTVHPTPCPLPYPPTASSRPPLTPSPRPPPHLPPLTTQTPPPHPFTLPTAHPPTASPCPPPLPAHLSPATPSPHPSPHHAHHLTPPSTYPSHQRQSPSCSESWPGKPGSSVQFSSVAQSCPTLCDPMNRSTPGLPVHHHLLEFTQTLCCPLLLLPPIPPSIRVFSNESTLRMRWPKYWSFSFSIIPSKEIPGLISFRMDWLDLLAVQGTLESLLQHHSSKASILWLSLLHSPTLTSIHDHRKTIALTRRTFIGKVMSLLLNMLSRLVITFLPRSKRLLISWLQSPSAVILEPKAIKSDTVSTVSIYFP
uniref:Uncharacterized protein n=1 Tax=Bos mutus grunniens TaxID=30521 RepID=A0A8B9WZE7_BOSMU